jgi:Immunity protein 21
MAVEWIESAGGPLVFAPASIARAWKGNALPADNGPSDYDKACAVSGEIGVLAHGGAQLLVLGDEPDRTALIETPGVITVVRWRWAASEEALLESLKRRERRSPVVGPSGIFTAKPEMYVLFDSALGGDEIDRALTIPLRAGTYSFDTIEHRPDRETCALLHRIYAVH